MDPVSLFVLAALAAGYFYLRKPSSDGVGASSVPPAPDPLPHAPRWTFPTAPTVEPSTIAPGEPAPGSGTPPPAPETPATPVTPPPVTETPPAAPTTIFLNGLRDVNGVYWIAEWDDASGRFAATAHSGLYAGNVRYDATEAELASNIGLIAEGYFNPAAGPFGAADAEFLRVFIDANDVVWRIEPASGALIARAEGYGALPGGYGPSVTATTEEDLLAKILDRAASYSA